MSSDALQIQSIKFENLVFGYENHEPLLNQVDFEFPVGEMVWVMANTGAGRSSLLQLMAGLQSPSQGKYLINDVDMAEMSFEEFLPYRLEIGYGFDMGGLINNRSLLENVTLPLIYHKVVPLDEALFRAFGYFEKMNITKYKDLRPAFVPGGIRKLTCLIRALVTHPQILLLDDPSVGLGQDTILRYFDCVQELRKQGRAQHVFISSFDDKLMGCIPHKEIFLDCGQIYLDQADRPDSKKVVNL